MIDNLADGLCLKVLVLGSVPALQKVIVEFLHGKHSRAGCVRWIFARSHGGDKLNHSHRVFPSWIRIGRR